MQTGDIFFNGMFPYIDDGTGGSVSGMIAGATKLLAVADNNTKIVPGHGPLGNKADLMKYRDMLTTVRDAAPETEDPPARPWTKRSPQNLSTISIRSGAMACLRAPRSFKSHIRRCEKSRSSAATLAAGGWLCYQGASDTEISHKLCGRDTL